MNKKTLLLLMTVMLFICGTAASDVNGYFSGYSIVNVKVNGNPVEGDVPAIIFHGRTMVPVLFISEALGASVEWDENTQTVTIAEKKPGTNKLDSLLIASVLNNDNTEVERLLKSGANANAEYLENTGLNIIVIPAERDEVEITSLLIQYGSLTDPKDNLNNTPLHSAALNGSKNVTQILISCGADVNAQNFRGITPLILASSAGHYDVVQLLLLNGADKKVVSYEDLTALDYAEQHGYKKVAELIASYTK